MESRAVGLPIALPEARRPFWFPPGRCHVLRKIRRGGTATVYEARTGADLPVALKVSRPKVSATQLERMATEAELGRRLSHRAIPRVFEFGRFSGGVWLTMELVDGEPLSRALGRPHLDGRARLCLLIELTDVLAHVHDAGVIHRDVKPTNVLLTKAGLKLVDFGAAKIGGQSLTGPNRVVGTPDYMAPEQVLAQPLDHRVDIFQIGLIAFELFASRPAWPQKKSLLEIGRALCFEAPASLSSCLRKDLGLPEGAIERLNGIVTKSLARHPYHRFDSAGDLGDALRGVLELL